MPLLMWWIGEQVFLEEYMIWPVEALVISWRKAHWNPPSDSSRLVGNVSWWLVALEIPMHERQRSTHDFNMIRMDEFQKMIPCMYFSAPKKGRILSSEHLIFEGGDPILPNTIMRWLMASSTTPGDHPHKALFAFFSFILDEITASTRNYLD